MTVRFFLIVFLLGLKLGHAQLYEVTRYADDNGLPSRIVHDVVQDSLGYLWVAGNNGLYKFDGSTFHSYYAKLNDTSGLRSNKVNKLIASKDQRLWIGTPSGLHVLERDSIRYVSLASRKRENQNHVITLFEDSRGAIWVGTYEGFFRIDPISNTASEFPEIQNVAQEAASVWGVSEDSEGNIWIGRGDASPLIYDPQTGTFRLVKVLLEMSEIPEDLILFEFVEFEPGLFLIESSNGLLKGVLQGDNKLIVDYFYTPEGKPASTNFIYKVLVDSQGSIWTATWKYYCRKFVLKDGFLVEVALQGTKDFDKMSNFSRSVFEDAQKNIWMPNSNGLFKFSKAGDRISVFPPPHLENCLENVSIYSILEDKKNRFWINTPSHLYRINKRDILEGKCPTKYLAFDDEKFQLARDMIIDSQNRLWISGQGGISISQLDFNDEPGPFFHLNVPKGLPHLWSYEVLEENPQTFWVGNYHRLLKITFEEDNFRAPKITTFDSSPDRADALINSYSLQLAKDRNGKLWVGTFSGLSKLQSEEDGGHFKNYSSVFGKADHLSNNSIKRIFVDSQGRIWIGTQEGLNLYQETDDSFLQFGRQEGLPSEYILGIAEDSQGYLWVTTTNGVFRGIYNASMQGFVHIEYFHTKDGLADNISNRNALYIDKEDNVFIGSSKGISVLNPLKAVQEARPFHLGVTTLECIQQKETGFVSILDRMKDETLHLSYYENSIRLQYSVLDFTQPKFNQYRHKFLPLNEDWIYTGNDSKLTYYNLPPGSYELILDGQNNQGIWKETPIKLTLFIAPPFWKSDWALTVYVVFGLALIVMLYMLRIRKRVRELEQETRLEKALIRERELLRNQNAADFHDELGSKVTKLSMYLTLVERNLQENADTASWLGKMRDTIKELSGSFRDLLWVIDPQKDTLGDTIIRLRDFGEDLFQTTETNFRCSGFQDILLAVNIDPQTKKQLIMVFKEAMHNCAKHAEASEVILNVSLTDNLAMMQLLDNGKGFLPNAVDEGRGLRNMKLRCLRIGALLTVESSNGSTKIQVSAIPILETRNALQ
ncbi:MAG: two-component regulator propeller domain-containing protein [Flavobacteriaceae bacterium]